MDLIEKLGIDWRLLLAQIVNFLVILFVLHRFAYKPILAALERRTRKIAEGVRYAKEMEDRRAALASEVDAKLVDTNRAAQRIIADASTAAEQLKAQVREEAKAETARATGRLQDTLAAERRQVLDEMRGEVADLVVSTTEKVLRERLTASDRTAFLEAATKELER